MIKIKKLEDIRDGKRFRKVPKGVVYEVNRKEKEVICTSLLTNRTYRFSKKMGVYPNV